MLKNLFMFIFVSMMEFKNVIIISRKFYKALLMPGFFSSRDFSQRIYDAFLVFGLSFSTDYAFAFSSKTLQLLSGVFRNI